MLLNRVEYVLMNNPLRALVQRYVEARHLLRMGGPMSGGRALEIGCGRGIGVGLIVDVFGASSVDGFDLDPRMVELARRRLASRRLSARIWVGDAEAIAASDASYDAVFDFGIIHHATGWRDVLAEVRRVLKPGGIFYAEEVFARLINHPVARRLAKHPRQDRFDRLTFVSALEEAGLEPLASEELWQSFGWFVARRGRKTEVRSRESTE
jgi:ubiquinone/menaquinone biosynthesis C-methylase UbiE